MTTRGWLFLSHLGNTGMGTDDDDAGGEGLIPSIMNFDQFFWLGLFAGARALALLFVCFHC